MKNECSIIRDILPLYVENMVSEDTSEFVKEHLESCPACRAELEKLREPVEVQTEPQPDMDAAPLKRLKKALLMKKIADHPMHSSGAVGADAVGHLLSNRAGILHLFAGAGDSDGGSKRCGDALFQQRGHEL